MKALRRLREFEQHVAYSERTQVVHYDHRAGAKMSWNAWKRPKGAGAVGAEAAAR